ncbi:hypothetical protein J3R74_001800 [Puniceicoccus vermicola]
MPIVVEGEVEEDAFVGFLDFTIGIGEGAGEGAEVALVGPGLEVVVGNPDREGITAGRAIAYPYWDKTRSADRNCWMARI